MCNGEFVHATLNQVEAILRESAGRVLLPAFNDRSRIVSWYKSRGQPVSHADIASNELLTARLSTLLPGSFVFSEEASTPISLDQAAEDHKVIWIVDPLDGTSNFLRGCRRFGIIVALVVDGTVEGGWLYEPLSGRFAAAARGARAVFHSRKTTVGTASRTRLRMAVENPMAVRAAISRAFPGALISVASGSACSDYLDFLSGGLDGAVFTNPKPWDHFAGCFVAEMMGKSVVRSGASAIHVAERVDLNQRLVTATLNFAK